jgi:hypothetical protein
VKVFGRRLGKLGPVVEEPNRLVALAAEEAADLAAAVIVIDVERLSEVLEADCTEIHLR